VWTHFLALIYFLYAAAVRVSVLRSATNGDGGAALNGDLTSGVASDISDIVDLVSPLHISAADVLVQSFFYIAAVVCCFAST
jgi:hypothetical protein